MRKPHRKQLLAWLLTAALLLTNLPVSVLSEEIAELPIQAETVEQAEPETVEEPNFPDSPTEETGEPTEPPVSEEPNETPEPSEPSETVEIPADENTPDIPDQDESETPDPSDSDIKEPPSPEVPEETKAPDADSMDEPPVEEVPAEETPIPEESPLPNDEEAFSVSEAIWEYGYAYAAAYAESVIYEDADLTAPLFTLKEDGDVLLITEETETAFKVWWLTYADEPLSGYIAKLDISGISISEETRQMLKEQRPCGFITSDIGYMDAFVLFGELTTREEVPEATPTPEPQPPLLQAGDYAAVTTETRVYLSIDETMTEDDIELTVTVYSDETTRLSAENQMIQGKIRIVKTDSLTHEPLADVQFIITRLSAPPSANGAGVGETILLTTNEQGAAETGWLDYGRYCIEEAAVPAHYVDAPFRTEIDCFEGGKTYEIAATNEPTKGWLRLTKTDRKNGNPVAGVTFDIYENDAYGSTLVGSMTTDENGVAVSDPLRKGRYLVREHDETAGYVFEEITLDATVESDETTDLSATNQPVMTRIRIKKRDKDEYAQTDAPSVRGDGELTGATFRVLAGADMVPRRIRAAWCD